MRRRALLAALALACATPAAAQHVFLGPADAHALMQREPVTVLAAGQAPEQFARGHLAGARRVALGDIAVSRDGVPNELPPVGRLEQVLEGAGVDDARPVLVYGDPLAAARLWLTLDVLGHPRAYLLDGGLAGWEAAGLPLEGPGETRAEPSVGSFTPRLRPERLIAVDELSGKLDDPAYLLVDARSPGEYAGTQQSPQVPRPGHIPGARSVFWRRFMQSDSMPALRPRGELRALLAMPAGTTTLVAYCRTGHMASMLYAVARELELPVRLYDPSYVEWSGRGDLPVAQGDSGDGTR